MYLYNNSYYLNFIKYRFTVIYFIKILFKYHFLFIIIINLIVNFNSIILFIIIDYLFN